MKLRPQIKIILLCASTLLLSMSCNIFSEEGFQQYPVVEAYLVAEQPLPPVRLSATQPVDKEYNFRDASLNSAEIRLHLMDETGEHPENTFGYSVSSPGIYESQHNHSILPGRTYKLEAEVPDFGMVRAYTIIPDTFRINQNLIPGRIVYQSTEQIELSISPNQIPGRQNVYIINTRSLEPSEDRLTPFYSSAVDNGEFDIEDLENNPSHLINEGNFQVSPDGIKLFFPWIGVAFYGQNRITINSVDRNITDFIRSQDIQLGGSTLSPGEIPNAIYHIEGGIGVFGGVARDSVTTFVDRP